ncbi:cell division control protein 6 homolog [Paramormyrops kingsleyae]|uniref:cell division control protein 6 homolog n=1 Tax=Paramormyrops kingsleyae TaxID=1676925 RepID=UPI003B972CB3
MPSTRSQSQPTLQFPRRKSSRVNSTPKNVAQSPNPGSIKLNSALQQSLPSKATTVKNSKSAPQSPRQGVLPLSPRKRTGDENGCNLPSKLQGSPPKVICRRLPASSPRKLAFDENSPVCSVQHKGPASPKSTRSEQETLDSRSPIKCSAETPGSTRPCPGKRAPVVRLFSEEESLYQNVKQALHTTVPECLLSREAERASIRSFLVERVLKGLPSSLYISGAPGTGKTACLNCILEEMESDLRAVQTIVVNCMTLRTSHSIFPLLCKRLGISADNRCLEKLLTKAGPTVLLVLDEMDQLDSKAQDVLYSLFEWPHLPGSRLCLIGIANALDLTDRILPRLQARPNCRPQLLHFPPYSRQELTAIVQDRLSKVSGNAVLDTAAVQFCARKVSAVSGDARKALDICRRAVEMVESRANMSNQSSEQRELRVSVPQVAQVLSEVYGDRMAAGGGTDESFPLQQKLLVCCLLMLIRQGKSREVHLGKLQEAYSRLCTEKQVVGIGQSECLSLCSLLESRGIFSLKKAKEARLTKVSLKVEERDVENALKDRALLGSILSASLP